MRGRGRGGDSRKRSVVKRKRQWRNYNMEVRFGGRATGAAAVDKLC